MSILKLKILSLVVIVACLGLISGVIFSHSTRSWSRPDNSSLVSVIARSETNKAILDNAITSSSTGSSPVKESAAGLNFLSFGDIMLDRGVRQIITKHGLDYLLENLKKDNFFSGHDYVAANLEGAVTASGEHLSPVYANDFAFFPANILSLKKYNFNIFNLANNHLSDQGMEGEKSTRKFLQANSFAFFGCRDKVIADCSMTITKNGSTSVAWLGFSQVYGKLDQKKVVAKIQEAKKQANFVIINIHWGSEYQLQFSKGQQDLAHAMIDTGADMIIGHHPHAVQGVEKYKGALIFYSLGNFIFDQYFSVKTQQGLGLRVKLSEPETMVDLLPLDLVKSRPRLMTGKQRQIMLSDIAGYSPSDEQIKEQIRSGKIIIKHE